MLRVDLHSFSRTGKPPLHKQLADLLRQAITDGVYQPGERIESERRFIEEGELSYPTVARAFQTLVDEGLITRRIGSGTYVNRKPAPRARTSARRFGIFYYRLHTPYYEAMLSGARAEAALHGVELVAMETGEALSGEDQVIDAMRQQGVDGIIGTPFGSTNAGRTLRYMIEHGVPVVIIGAQMPQLPCDSITINDEHGAELLARHLLELGHRRIAIIANQSRYPRSPLGAIRTGVNRMFERFDMKRDESHDTLLPMFFHEVEDQQVLDQVRAMWRDLDNGPTAVIGATDPLAHLVMDQATSLGLRVPEDISIAGFGDFPVAMQVRPQLTTIPWPLARAGCEAVRRLIERTDYPERHPTQVILDTSLLIRRSTAQVATRWR